MFEFLRIHLPIYLVSCRTLLVHGLGMDLFCVIIIGSVVKGIK